jgi:hypothetical protein
MFLFITKHLGFLKHIPGLAILFDNWLKLWMLITNPIVLDNIDEIEIEVLRWENTSTTIHKYGGLQLNFNGKEIGHIHSNGLLDMLLSRNIKQELIMEGNIEEHHLFKNTGWISFYMYVTADKEYALKLLKLAYTNQNRHSLTLPTRLS